MTKCKAVAPSPPKDDSPAQHVAHAVIHPAVRSAHSVKAWAPRSSSVPLDPGALAGELSKLAAAVNNGDMSHPEALLVGQSQTLDAVFHELLGIARHSMANPEVLDTMMRLALRAQSQCRASLETLSLIKNPRAVSFVRQANIGTNQQINNAPRARKKDRIAKVNDQSSLQVLPHGERLEQRAPATNGEGNSSVGTMDAIDWPENRRRKTPSDA